MVVMRSCCCCSMRTGSLIIAVLYMLFTGLILLGLGLMLAYFNDSFRPLLAVATQDNPSNETSAITDAIDSNVKMVQNVLITSIILKTLYFFLCLLLFVGVVKESTAYLIPWLVAEFLRQIFFLAAFIYLAWLISVLVMKQYTESNVLVIVCIVMIVIIGITFYFWLGIIGAAQEFRERDKRITPADDAKAVYPQTGPFTI